MGLSIKSPPSNSAENNPLKKVGCILMNTASPNKNAIAVNIIVINREKIGKGAKYLPPYQDIPITATEIPIPAAAAKKIPYKL